MVWLVVNLAVSFCMLALPSVVRPKRHRIVTAEGEREPG